MSKESIVILGAGLIGRMLAHACAQAGYAVRVFDKGTLQIKQSAAYAAAAMLAPCAESVSTEKNVVDMGVYSLNRWPAILQQLSSPVYFQQTGSLILWHQQDASLGKHFQAQIARTTSLLPKQYTAQKMTPTALEQLEPELDSRFREGLYLPGEGQLDNRELLEALRLEAIQLGVQFFWETPKDPADFSDSRHTFLIDCRGMGAQSSLPNLRGVRGEVIRIHAPEVNLRRPIRLLHPRYPIYIAPKGNHLYVIGATEVESEDYSEMSVRSALELLSAAYSLHSGFAEGRILELNAQCRPSLPNNLPLIEQVNDREIRVNGLYRHGYLISPAIMDALMEIILAQPPQLAHQFAILAQLPIPQLN